jgi:hypothetical protein
MNDPRPDRVRNAEDTILDLHAENERLRAAASAKRMYACMPGCTQQGDVIVGGEGQALRSRL